MAVASCFNLVISNKLSGGVREVGREPLEVDGAALLLLPAADWEASGVDGCARTDAGVAGLFGTAGGDRNGDGGMPTGALTGAGSGELRDFRDCKSSFLSRSISSFFFCCSLTNDDTETSSFIGFGTVLETLAAEIVSMSRTRSRSRSFSSSACIIDED